MQVDIYKKAIAKPKYGVIWAHMKQNIFQDEILLKV